MNEWKKFSHARPREGQQVWWFEDGKVWPLVYSYDASYYHPSQAMWTPAIAPAPPVIKSPAELWAEKRAKECGCQAWTGLLIEAYNAGANERSK